MDKIRELWKKKSTKIAVVVVVALIVIIASATKDKSKDSSNSSTSTKVAEKTKKTTESSSNVDTNSSTNESKPSSDESSSEVSNPEEDHYDDALKGRGEADSGREEPNYINVIGYVAPAASQKYDIENSDKFQDESLWNVPTYEQDKQFWNENGYLPYKTEVVVREQMLKHKGYGSYEGYLLVEKKDDGTKYYIDVNSFVTRPYWTYKSVSSAAKEGDLVAEYHQTSDFYPVFSNGEKAEIEEGTVVLVKGTTSARKVDKNNNGIEAKVWKEWSKGYGGVEVFFNAADLKIIY